MAKGRLPDGYRGVDLIIKEFRIKNPKGKVETTPVLMGDGYVIITAKITTDDGAVGSGMADADVQEDKSVEKAESGAIRRALLTLGYESIAVDEDQEESSKRKEEEPKEEKKSFKRSEPAKKVEESDDEQDEDEEKKPKSRFGNKGLKRQADEKDSENDDDEESQEEGKSKFTRGSRFQRG